MKRSTASALGKAALWVLLSLGVIAFARVWARVSRAQELVEARGPLWEVVDAAGAAPARGRIPGGLAIEPGDRLHLRELPGDAAWDALQLRVQKIAVSSVLGVELARTDGDPLLVAVMARGPIDVVVAERRAGRPPRVRAQARLEDPLPSQYSPFELGIHRRGQTIDVSIDGAVALSYTDAALSAALPAVVVEEGAYGVRGLRIASVRGGAGAPVVTAHEADFAGLPARRDLARHAAGLAIACGALAAAALFLRALCLGAPPAGDIVVATAAWAAPCAAAVLGMARVDASPRTRIVALGGAAIVGLPLALFVARDHLSPRAARGRDATRGHDTGRVSDARWRSPVVAAAIVVAAGLALADRLADRSERAAEIMPIGAATPAAAPPPAPTRAIVEDVRLDAGNVLDIPGAWEDLDARARVVLAADSVLEIRVRAVPAPHVKGTALWIPSDARLRCSFVRETAQVFAPHGSNAAAVAPGEPIELELRIRGDALAADIGGRRVETHEAARDGSGLQLVAARGLVTIERLEVTPASDAASRVPIPAPDADSREPIPARGARSRLSIPGIRSAAVFAWRSLAIVGWLGALVLVFAAGMRAAGVMPLRRAVEVCAFATLPLAIGLPLAAGGGHVGFGGVAWVAGATCFVLGVPVLVHARAATRAGLAALGLLAVLASSLATLAIATHGRGAAALLPTASNYVAWSGEQLVDEYAYLQHPVLRLLNGYLADHRFRGREVALDKPAGTRRVIALGGSSTWGFGLPQADGAEFPAVLERLLNARAPESEPLNARAPESALLDARAPESARVEVLNAAYCGATGSRLYRFLRDGLLPFAPDVVVVCLTYNDAFALTTCDEEAYLRVAGAPTFARSAPRDLLDAWRIECGRQALSELLARHPRWPGSTQDLWDELGHPGSPPERFEAMLRRFTELAAREGFGLVIVKEPLAGDRRFIWKDEFGAAMDRVGADAGVPVLDPSPALAAAGGADLFQDEVHPRPGGHRVIAEQLLPIVRAALDR